MLGLLVTTILTSSVDSLNPFAITQQFVLQGMVKKPSHIWYFILPTGITNFAGGFLAYYGVVAFIGDFFKSVLERHGQVFFLVELALGIAFLISVCYLILNSRIKFLKKQLRKLSNGEGEVNDESKAAGKIKSVSPRALWLLGTGATISELTTALPYFAFMAVLFTHQLSLPQLLFILLVYNIIYMSPLMVLYFVYVKAQKSFDRLYLLIKRQITKWANILAPSLAGLVGVFLVFHSVSNLLK